MLGVMRIDRIDGRHPGTIGFVEVQLSDGGGSSTTRSARSAPGRGCSTTRAGGRVRGADGPSIRVLDSRAEHAEHQAGGGGDGDPGRPDPPPRAFELAISRLAGKGDDPRGPIDLLEPAHDLRLLRRQALGGERRIGGLEADDAHLFQPSAQVDRALGADLAPIDVGGSIARHTDFRERLFREMPTTKHDVSEPHG